jgi:hypothetical protein
LPAHQEPGSGGHETKAEIVAKLRLPAMIRIHDGTELHVREHHHGINQGETQSILADKFRMNQLGQEH